MSALNPSNTPEPTDPPKNIPPEPEPSASPPAATVVTPVEPPKNAPVEAAQSTPEPIKAATEPVEPPKAPAAETTQASSIPATIAVIPAVPPEAIKETIAKTTPFSADVVTEAPKISQTARVTKSNWSLLGRTQGQRGAEVLAAIRGKFDPTPEHTALKRGGAESLITAYIKDPVSIAVVVGRPKYFQALIEREVAGIDSPVIIEMASGFLPRGLLLAREHPTWHVIEVDLPDVIHEKRVRYTLNNIPLPPNLEMKAADLGVTPLKDVIGDHKADIVTAEGLMPYFNAEDQQMCAQYVADCLRPNGKFIFDITWVESIVSNNDISNMMKRQAGNFLIGYVESVEEAKTRYGTLGYESITVYRPLQLEKELPELPSLMVDAVLLVIAKKGA